MYILKLLVILLLLIPMRIEARRRINEGKAATDTKEMPFIVAVTVALAEEDPVKGQPTACCTGVYIRPLWVLTATHCITDQLPIKDNKPKFPVNCCMGAVEPTSCPEKDKRLANGLYPHTNGNPSYKANDVLLISVPKPWTLSSTIQIAKLPTGKVDKKTYNNVPCTVGGWGSVDAGPVPSPVLKLATAKVVVGSPNCKVEKGDPGTRQICVMGESGTACKGDSGGPLLCKGEVIAILRGGWGACTEDKSNYYNMIQEYNDWIVSIAGAGSRIVPNNLCLFVIYVTLYFFQILN